MIDENFYQKRVDELKRSLKSQTVFINESFSGGLFRTSAKDHLNELTIYHLLRGLEIDTESETYKVLAAALPKSQEFFIETKAETTYADNLIIAQLNYVVELTDNMENQLKGLFEVIKKQNSGEKIEDESLLSDTLYKEIIPIIKESGKDFSKIKKSIKAIQVSEALTQKTLIQNFIEVLKPKITSNKTGLNGAVYTEIDNMNLSKIDESKFDTKKTNYLTKAPDIDSALKSNNVVDRISMFLEKVIRAMGLPELTYISYTNNAFDYLSQVITMMSASGGIKPIITPSLLDEYKDVINKIGEKLITPEVEKLTSIYSNNLTIPSIQSLYVSLLSSMILKLINYNYEAIEATDKLKKEAQEKIKTELSEKLRTKYVSISNTFEQLKDTGFFENTKVFYEKKSYTLPEKKMILLLKMLFFKMGLITEAPSGYLERPTFDPAILGNAVKKFQSSLKIIGGGIQVDGRIGKNTRLALTVFAESLNSKL